MKSRANLRVIGELFPAEELRLAGKYENVYPLQAKQKRNREVMEQRRKIENGVEHE